MEKIIRNVIIFSVLLLLVAVVTVVAVYSPNVFSPSKGSNTDTNSNVNNVDVGNVVNANNGEVQNVKLSVVGGNYIITPSVLKKDIPVRMEADLSSLRGCSRDVVIAALGVRKYVKEGDNIITFTPTQTGTIRIACSMNMYTGSFTVE